MMLLKESRHSEADFSIASKESLTTKSPFALQGPHIDLLLAIRKGAVAWISTFFFRSNIWNMTTSAKSEEPSHSLKSFFLPATPTASVSLFQQGEEEEREMSPRYCESWLLLFAVMTSHQPHICITWGVSTSTAGCCTWPAQMTQWHGPAMLSSGCNLETNHQFWTIPRQCLSHPQNPRGHWQFASSALQLSPLGSRNQYHFTGVTYRQKTGDRLEFECKPATPNWEGERTHNAILTFTYIIWSHVLRFGWPWPDFFPGFIFRVLYSTY